MTHLPSDHDHIFPDRKTAGRLLAERLASLSSVSPLILALPRGGLPVAMEVARALNADLDLFTVRKTGVPDHEELAMGAVATGGIRWRNAEVMEHAGLDEDVFLQVAQREEAELQRRESAYRRGAPFPDVQGRTVVVVDDGLATGSTMRAAVMALRQRHPARIVVAAPVSSAAACQMIGELADETVCLTVPDTFVGVGSWYLDFLQLDDGDMAALLQELAAEGRGPWKDVDPSALARKEQWPEPREVTVRSGGLSLPGLAYEGSAAGPVVLLVHGSGSSRLSGRNQQVAAALAAAGMRAILFDLLTERETEYDEQTHALRFDIPLLSGRVEGILRWSQRFHGDAPVGLFGASTGAAVALTVAGRHPTRVGAVLSRGGRVDLAAEPLEEVSCPVLMLVGDQDVRVRDLNQEMLPHLGGLAELRVIRGAGHLFTEPGTIEEVATIAAEWFRRHLVV